MSGLALKVSLMPCSSMMLAGAASAPCTIATLPDVPVFLPHLATRALAVLTPMSCQSGPTKASLAVCTRCWTWMVGIPLSSARRTRRL